MENRVVDDSVHISRVPLVFYTDPREMPGPGTIQETRTRSRFEELFHRYQHSFEYGFKAYIRNLQNNKVVYSLPYKKSIPDKYGRTETFFPVVVDFSDCPEHSFGLPNKKDADAQRLLRKLVNAYKEGLKEEIEEQDSDIIDASKLTQEERLFLSNLGKAQVDELLSYNTLDDDSFDIQVKNIVNKLNTIQQKYKNKSAIQKEIIYQVHNLREMINIINENNYGSEKNFKYFMENRFVDEASNIIIRDLARSSKELPIMKNTKKGQSELEKLVRLNLSMFCINLNNEAFYDTYKQSEDLIKDKVYDKLATKYMKSILTDDEVLYELNQDHLLDINPTTNRQILDSNFIMENLNRNTIKNFEGYNVEQLASLIKKPNTSQTREEIIDNIDTYVGVINELDRILKTNPTEEAELARELVNYDLLEMLVLKDYQIEFARRSMHNKIKEAIKNETNQLLNQRITPYDGVKKHYHLNKLYNGNKKDNPLVELVQELNQNDGLMLEEELYKVETQARRTLFDKDVLKTKMNYEKYEDLPDITNLNNKYDMVEMIYLLTANDKVKEELYNIYSQNYEEVEEFIPSINYLKIAEKSEVIAEIGRIQDYSPIVRRVREEIEYNTGSIEKPVDSYMNNQYANDRNEKFNNTYLFEFLKTSDTSNAIYISPGTEMNTFHMSHALKDIPVTSLGADKTQIIAQVDNSSNYLPTPLGYDKDLVATVKSSDRIIIEKPIKISNPVIEGYKKNHNIAFNTIHVVEKEKNDIEKVENEIGKLNKNNVVNNLEKNDSLLFKKIPYETKEYEPKHNKNYEIHNYVQDQKEEINRMLSSDHVPIHSFVGNKKNDLNSMFDDTTDNSSSNKNQK